MSVDLVGSTAYKSSFLNKQVKSRKANFDWVTRFRHFYQKFPEALAAAFRATEAGHQELAGSDQPKIWKTIGDEIIFCCRVRSVEHVACCISAFLKALEAYGHNLEADKVPLDVKGSGWLAAFPAENISIEIYDGNIASTKQNEDYPTEAFEMQADDVPHQFDFLGTGIDAGFRIAKNSATDRFAISVGLAYVLANATQSNMFRGQFRYHGRESLKGVAQGHPYPVISIETERNLHKRKLIAREMLLSGDQFAPPIALFDYLNDFLEEEGIDRPSLPLRPSDALPEPPASYVEYKPIWEVNVKEVRVREEGIQDAEKSGNEGGLEISQDILDYTGKILQQWNLVIDPSIEKRKRQRVLRSRAKKPE